MSLWRKWVCLSWMGLAAACGGTDAEEDEGPGGTRVDCSWFQGDNCYKQAMATMESCLEPGFGTFSADGTRCAYPTGTTINFRNPVELGGPLEQDWDFDIVTNFGRCVSYQETRTGMRLETRAGTFTTETSGGAMQITCPDGTRFYMARALDALDCGLENLPGNFTSRSGGSMTFGLTGGPGGEFVNVFTCEEP